MNQSTQDYLITHLTRLADNELLLAHRNSEWTGHAPILEEDIALANIAQDELGHAVVWYRLLEALTGKSGDEMVFLRPAEAWHNSLLVALPKGDWAFTMMRQYLFDAFEHVLLRALTGSPYQPLADACAKIVNEEIYHLRHSHLWVEMLAHGTDESHERVQTALNRLWPYFLALFESPTPDQVLPEFPDWATLQEPVMAIVRPHLEACGLDLTTVDATAAVDDSHLHGLLQDLQKVAQADPQADW